MSPEPLHMGWDVGGAHLKVALVDARGGVRRVAQYATPLWRGLDSLEQALARCAAEFPVDRVDHALTMTGELADLFPDRAEGVRRLIDFVAERLPSGRLGIYAGPDGLLAPARARDRSAAVASANWHATAALCARRLTAGLLVDVGSTTADLLGFADGKVRHHGYTDRERLASGELVYTGVVRTPVMSLCERVPLRGTWVALAAEHFATTADVYRLTGDLAAHADQADTADGRGRSVAESAVRLARMLGEDAAALAHAEWVALAAYLAECQLQKIHQSAALQLSRGLPRHAPLIGAGVGRFLVRRLAARLGRDYLDFDELFPVAAAGPAFRGADCAPALAVALLAAWERRAA